MTNGQTIPDDVAQAIEVTLSDYDLRALASDITDAVLATIVATHCDDMTLEPTVGQLLTIGWELASGHADRAFDAFIALSQTGTER